MTYRFRLLSASCAAIGTIALAAHAQAPSPVIHGIEWAPVETIVRLAQGSDNWPMTWAEDGALYAAYGDGYGFKPHLKEKLSLGLARITGAPPDMHGTNLRSETAEARGDGRRGRKASGMLCVDGVLYMLVRNAAKAQLGWSTDHGQTWTWADWRFTTSFGCPTFLNFGKNYTEARDAFVYVYSPDSDSAYVAADQFVLTRAHKDRLCDQQAWEFFVDCDAKNRPRWSPDVQKRGAVLARPKKCYRSGVTYNPGLRRYLWCQTQPDHHGLTICDAPEPWGPWTTVFSTAEWDTGAGESCSLPALWMGDDGQTVHLASSGGDCLAVRRAKLLVNQGIQPPAQQFSIDADYPGGNIVVERLEGDSAFLHQDLRDTKGWWFYWGFRVRGARNRTLTFHFTNKNVIGVRGPAVSRDGGETWRWLGTDTVRATSDGIAFSYAFHDEAGEARFCFAMPYQLSHLARFLDRYAKNPNLRVDTLCRTRNGRRNLRVHAGRLDGNAEVRVLVTCRHHACESMASYALEGFLDTALGASDHGRWLRENVEILAIPTMDLDGVEGGNQGKNRIPRDHNRDYGNDSIYPSVKALRECVPEWSGGRLVAAIDLHCPYIRGRHNEVIYLVGSEAPAIWKEQCTLAKALETHRSGPLPYRASDNLPFGEAWNTQANYKAGTSFGRWAGSLPGIRLATTIEIPYANAGGQPVTAESARMFGTDLANALVRYLQSDRN